MALRARDRKFMNIALDEMRKSRSEHVIKIDPLVGAVLVDANGAELDRAHRGSLRVGDHAEYTLVERLLHDRDLEGSTLYVTLEPCTVRQQPKVSCTERIISARIGRVVIGMPDPNPDIEGKGIARLLESGVAVDFFDSDLASEVRQENSGFIEYYSSASQDSGESSGDFEGPSEKEKEVVPVAKVGDFSTELMGKYLHVRSRELLVPSPELWSFFSSNGFVVSTREDGQCVPTVAGLLLFGNHPEDFLVQSGVKVEARDGTKVVTDDLGGPLLSMPAKIDDFLSRHMRTFTEIRGLERVEVPEYPREALREAVVNAVVHRDYKEGARTMIQMLQDRIVIRSPGLPLHPLTLEKIRACNAPPYSRNPRIARAFSHMGLMEERGWGLRRMCDIVSDSGLQPPDFSYDSGYFVVTLFGYAEALPSIPPELSPLEAQLWDFVRRHGTVSSSECVEGLGVVKRTVQRHLKRMVENGRLERRGIGPEIVYFVKRR